MIIQEELFKPNTIHLPVSASIPFVVAFSGGKDSSALLLWIRRNYPSNPVIALYNDTGFEHPGILKFIRAFTKSLDVPLRITSPRLPLLDMIRQQGIVPGFGCRYCSGRLKRDPSAKFIRKTFESGEVVLCVGLRGEESPRRAKKEQIELNLRLSTTKRKVINYYPLLEWRTSDVVGYVKGNGFKLFHTYEYLPRLSCRHCFLSGKKGLILTRQTDAVAFNLVSEVLGDIK